jgi:hypothetical protein
MIPESTALAISTNGLTPATIIRIPSKRSGQRIRRQETNNLEGALLAAVGIVGVEGHLVAGDVGDQARSPQMIDVDLPFFRVIILFPEECLLQYQISSCAGD